MSLRSLGSTRRRGYHHHADNRRHDVPCEASKDHQSCLVYHVEGVNRTETEMEVKLLRSQKLQYEQFLP